MIYMAGIGQQINDLLAEETNEVKLILYEREILFDIDLQLQLVNKRLLRVLKRHLHDAP